MVAYVTKKRDTRHTRNGLCLDEDEARFFFKQLIYAVQFCHKHHVAHRCGPAHCSCCVLLGIYSQPMHLGAVRSCCGRSGHLCHWTFACRHLMPSSSTPSHPTSHPTHPLHPRLTHPQGPEAGQHDP
jgi:hypothetical protein